MPDQPTLSTPDWDVLKGGMTEDKWQEDRLRKFGRIKTTAPAIALLQENLAEEGALYRCSPVILKKHPSAAGWYVALACFAGKTLKNLQQRAKVEFNLSILPERFVENLEKRPNSVSDADLAAFSGWINDELESVIGDGLEEDGLAALHVAMIAGGRVLGQGQNEGGELAVAMLKQALVDHFGPEDEWEYRAEGDAAWRDVGDDLTVALQAPVWRHAATGTVFDFSPGGNRPDVKALRDDTTLMVGEVKGRKDLSNTWESWMPTVSGHMESWKGSYPSAYRGAFMTVFTEEMIEGRSAKNVEQREGFKQLHEKGSLHFAINLSLLAANEDVTCAQFRELISAILGIQPEASE